MARSQHHPIGCAYAFRCVPFSLVRCWCVGGRLCCAGLRSTILVNIDKDTQRMTVTVDGAQRYVWPVSTGRAGYDTPSGTFRPNRMDADHLSQEWDNAPMPHTIFFDLHGHAIHGFNDTRRIGSPASHGCVRLAPQNAATLYALVEAQGMKDTTVVVSGHTPTGSEIARRGGVPVADPAAGPPVEIAPGRGSTAGFRPAGSRRLRTTAAAHIVRAATVRRTGAACRRAPGRAAAATGFFGQPPQPPPLRPTIVCATALRATTVRTAARICAVFRWAGLLRAAGLPATIRPAILR